MYIIAILLASIMALIMGPIDTIASFNQGRIALAIIQIIITALFFAVAILIFAIREKRGNFELDVNDDDDATTMSLKNAGGYCLGAATILLIISWFCCLGNII
ncbi:MAG: hypothetical protein Q4A70_03540 [Candidatus Saccharibacteria bacterium]|nr:hypothetical protein [Candidatus Saccharibacteria bacterium]